MVRKHEGIHQNGGNIGKLKKGYKYTGLKTKNGLPIIKKVKTTLPKKMKGGEVKDGDYAICKVEMPHQKNNIETLKRTLQKYFIACEGYRNLKNTNDSKHMITIDIKQPKYNEILSGLNEPWIINNSFEIYEKLINNQYKQSKFNIFKKINKEDETNDYVYKYYKLYKKNKDKNKEDSINNFKNIINKYNLLDKKSLDNTLELQNLFREYKSNGNFIMDGNDTPYEESKGYPLELLYKLLKYMQNNSNYDQLILYAMALNKENNTVLNNEELRNHGLIKFYKSLNMDMIIIPYQKRTFASASKSFDFNLKKKELNGNAIFIGRISDILKSKRFENLDKNLNIKLCNNTNQYCKELEN